MTRLNAVAGQTEEERGMEREEMSMGRMTANPETKNSVRSWEKQMLKTKRISERGVVKMGGRSRPRREMRASRDSGSEEWEVWRFCEGFGLVEIDGVAGLAGMVEDWILDCTGDIWELRLSRLSLRGTVAGE